MRLQPLSREDIALLQKQFSVNPATGEIWLNGPGEKVRIHWPDRILRAHEYPQVTVILTAKRINIYYGRLMWIVATGQNPPTCITYADKSRVNTRASNLCNGSFFTLDTYLSRTIIENT